MNLSAPLPLPHLPAEHRFHAPGAPSQGEERELPVFWVEPKGATNHIAPRLPQNCKHPLYINSETAPMTAVIIGHPTAENYGQINPINHHARETLEGKSAVVTLADAQREFYRFRFTLEKYGVEVFSPKAIPGSWDQIYTRDIAVVVGDTIVPCRMNLPDRKVEPRALAALFAQINKNSGFGKLKVAPHKDEQGHRICFEGGDIFVHENCIYIAESQRTNAAAIKWFRKEFGDKYNVIAVPLKPPAPGKEALHLDCAKNICGLVPTFVLHLDSFVNPDSFLNSLPANARVVEISGNEQRRLGSNFLSVNPRTVILGDDCHETAEKLSGLGITVELLPFRAARNMGGSFRCCSFVLRREPAFPSK